MNNNYRNPGDVYRENKFYDDTLKELFKRHVFLYEIELPPVPNINGNDNTQSTRFECIWFRFTATMRNMEIKKETLFDYDTWYTWDNFLDFVRKENAQYHADKDKYQSKVKGILKSKAENSVFNSFDDIFTIRDWQKYVDALTLCNPALLKKEDDKYLFIGNQKTQKSCIAQWFKFLKMKGFINQNIGRDDLAKVLTNEIDNFTVAGSSIDNQSNGYTNIFEPQLKKYLA
jgi:hypothetical protein